MREPLTLPSVPERNRVLDLGIYAALLLVSLALTCFNIGNSGPLWPDTAQYLNAAAMIHDWLLSGELAHPYAFAIKNYNQYPAFHLPYHPPVYPGLLGLFFLVTGVSYAAARFFIGLCLGVAAGAFFNIQQGLGRTRLAACWSSLLLIGIPEIALWSRDAMSEVPGLALIFLASALFLAWLNNNKPLVFLAAFVVAEAAFLSRYLTAGILPAWLLWAYLSGKTHRLKSVIGIAAPAGYLLVSVSWVWWSRSFSAYENGSGDTGPIVNYAAPFSSSLFSFYARQLPAMVGYLTLVASACAMAYGLYHYRDRLNRWFWLSWFVSYLALVAAVGIFDENRYFIYALPPFAGWMATLVDAPQTHRGKAATWAVAFLCLIANLLRWQSLPQGVVGGGPIGRALAQLPETGNILIASPYQAQLIFSFRSHDTRVRRTFIRADRTLVIRPPGYTNVQLKVLVHSPDEVLRLFQRGRVRYLLTSASLDGDRPLAQELELIDLTIASRPESFVLLKKFRLDGAGGGPGSGDIVSLWAYSGDIQPGPSELPVVIPTANWVLGQP